MKKLNELDLQLQQNKLPEKPTEESTRCWLAGMDKCWQEFLKLHREGHIPHVSDKDIQEFLSGDAQ
jgi:hypothetical protein